MNNKYFWFRVVAGWAAIYHGALAVMGTFASPEMITKIVKIVYGVELTVTSQITYLVKFISAYFFAFATVMALLAWSPVKYRHLVWVAIILFAIRIFDRLFFMDLLREAFGGEFVRDMATVAILMIMGGLLVVLRPKEG